MKVKTTKSNKVVIICDLEKAAGYTRRGNVMLASSNGTLQLPGRKGELRAEKLSLSIWRHPTPTERAAKQIVVSD